MAVRVAAEVADGWAPILEMIELRSGDKGVFKVSLDGRILFDKAEAGRVPQEREIANEIANRLGHPIPWRKTR